jgi:Fic family protein
MDDLVQLLHYEPKEEDQFEIPIVIRMAIAHAQFETIHPFSDGNGRVGRLILPLMLAAEEYPPVYIAGFLKDNQQEYYDSLFQVQTRGNWVAWVKFFAEGVRAACQESIRTAQALEALLLEWKDLVSTLRLRSDSAVRKFPDILIGTPVVTARQVQASLHISFPAASNALNILEQYGVLEQPKQLQRNRLFVARRVIEILDQKPA